MISLQTRQEIKRELRQANSTLNSIAEILYSWGEVKTVESIREVRLNVYNGLIDVIEEIEK